MEIEKAEAIRSELITKRDALVARGAEIEKERAALSFAGHAEGDKAALKRLDALHIEHAKHESELKSIQAAIAQSDARLELARRDAAAAEDREAALALREELAYFCELGTKMDEALKIVTWASVEMRDTLVEMQKFGARSPSLEQLNVLGKLAFLTALQATVWRKEFEPIPPSARRNFSGLIAGWRAQLEPAIADRLGEKKEEAA